MTTPLETVISRALGLPLTAVHISLRKPLEFQSNRLYNVRTDKQHFIAKEFLKPDELREAPAREFFALQQLQPLQIAPRPVYYDPDVAPIVVYEFLDGQMWARKRPDATDLGQLAQVWLKIHTVPTEGLWLSRGYDQSLTDVTARTRRHFNSYADWVAAEFPAGQRGAEYGLSLLQKLQTIAQELATYSPLLCFCRADARFANIIRQPDGRLGLVDWEDSGLRDPACDVADLITHPNQEDLLRFDEWRPFTQPYFAARIDVDPTLEKRVHLYLGIFSIFWLAIFLNVGLNRVQSGQTTTWQINGQPAHLRLQRYLARALTWPDKTFLSHLSSLESVIFFPVR
jgi:aminoglycoside phosphotransferase (APT) family kinase protein